MTSKAAKFGSKSYRGVLEMVRDTSDDPTFADELEKHIAERRLIKRLVARRCAIGMSQKDIAAKMGCSQGRISKLESAADDDLRLGDVKDYAKALGLCTILGLEAGPNAVARVKFHAACIEREVDSLATLALEDEAIAKGVSKFFTGTAFQLLKMLDSATKKLPPGAEPLGVRMEIVGPDLDECDRRPEIRPTVTRPAKKQPVGR